MLRSLRKSAGSWVVRIFLGLLAVLFGVGIWSDPGSVLRSRSHTAIATVGEVDIQPQEFGSEYRREATRARASLGEAFDTDEGLKRQVADAVVQRLALRAQLDQEADRLGLAVSDDLVRGLIVRDPAFQGATGAFDPNVFAGRIANEGLNEQLYVALMRRDIMRQQLVGTVAEPALVPETLVRALLSSRTEQRVLDMIVVPSSSVSAVREPAEADLRAHYDANPELYTAPEVRAVSYVRVDPASLADQVTVDEAAVQALYEDRADQLRQPERRVIRQILLRDQAAAQSVRDRIERGETFEAVTADLPAGSVNDLGAMATADFFDTAMADAAFATQARHASPPVQSPLGWHVFFVDGIEPAREVSFADARAQLERELKLEGAADAAFDLANSLDDALASGATLAEAAQDHGLVPTSIAAIDATGKAPDGTKVTVPEPADKFLATAFATEEGSTSTLVETETGFYVVHVDGVTPPTLKPFEAVAEQLEADWTAAERDRLAAEAVAQAAAGLGAGGDMTAAAQALGAVVVRTEPFRRDQGPAVATLPATIVTAIFQGKVGDIFTTPTDDATGHVLARLAEIRPADPAAMAGAAEQLRRNLVDAYGNDLAAAYGQALDRIYPVDVEQSLLDPLL